VDGRDEPAGRDKKPTPSADDNAAGGGTVPRPLLPAPVWAAIAGALALLALWLVLFMPQAAPRQDFAGDVPGLDEDLFDQPSGAVDTAAQLARLREMVPPDQRARPNPLEPTPEVLARARTIFGSQCAVCHGPNGDANVAVARTLNPPPVNFTHPAFADMEPGATFHIIKNGVATTGMPAFGASLSDEDIWGLVHFLRTNFVSVDHRTDTVVPPPTP